MTAVRDWEPAGRVKVKRAHEHSCQLASEVSAFLQRRPYSAVPESDVETREVRFVAHIAEQPDLLRWSTAVNDVVHNLRVALDFLWRQVAYPSQPKATFPSFQTRVQFESHFGLNQIRPPKSIPKAAVEVLAALEPYGDATRPDLWRIVELDNEGKHQLLTVVAHAVAATRPVAIFPIMQLRQEVIGSAEVEEGAPLLTLPAVDAGKTQFYPEFRFTVALRDWRCPRAEPVHFMTARFVEEVERAAEAFRIAGLIS